MDISSLGVQQREREEWSERGRALVCIVINHFIRAICDAGCFLPHSQYGTSLEH